MTEDTYGRARARGHREQPGSLYTRGSEQLTLAYERGARTWWAANEELHFGSTRAVAHSDGTSEGNKVAGRDTVLGDERLLQVDDLIGTEVSMEVGLDVREEERRAVSSLASVKQNQS